MIEECIFCNKPVTDENDVEFYGDRHGNCNEERDRREHENKCVICGENEVIFDTDTSDACDDCRSNKRDFQGYPAHD